MVEIDIWALNWIIIERKLCVFNVNWFNSRFTIFQTNLQMQVSKAEKQRGLGINLIESTSILIGRTSVNLLTKEHNLLSIVKFVTHKIFHLTKTIKQETKWINCAPRTDYNFTGMFCFQIFNMLHACLDQDLLSIWYHQLFYGGNSA